MVTEFVVVLVVEIVMVVATGKCLDILNLYVALFCASLAATLTIVK